MPGQEGEQTLGGTVATGTECEWRTTSRQHSVFFWYHTVKPHLIHHHRGPVSRYKWHIFPLNLRHIKAGVAAAAATCYPFHLNM